MATYLIKKKITITRQIGDLADITLLVPATLSMTGREARFQIWDAEHTVLELGKTSFEITGDIVITGQSVYIPLLPEDTLDLTEGNHLWELEVSVTGQTDETPITIGQGTFVAVLTLIPPIVEP